MIKQLSFVATEAEIDYYYRIYLFKLKNLMNSHSATILLDLSCFKKAFIYQTLRVYKGYVEESICNILTEYYWIFLVFSILSESAKMIKSTT